MASHFECIGFPTSQAELFPLIDRIFTQAQRQTTPHGDYAPWIDGSGAEAWLQLDGMNVLGFEPHFYGVSRMRCNLTTQVKKDSPSPLDTALHAWINPGESGEGEYPLVFDCPDYHAAPPLAFPQVAQVQLALFPESTSLFVSEEDFANSQADRDLKYASRCLIPSGLFGDEAPRAKAVAAGVVKEVTSRRNSLTGLPFIAVAYETLGGTYDLVFPCDDDTKRLAPGNIIFGEFWVSGRIVRQKGPPPLLGR